MLEAVEPRFLVGLATVVLTNTGALNRTRRRGITRVRGRKVRLARCGGLYHRAHRGDRAWIEIFADEVVGWWPRWLRGPAALRELIVGQVLYHEIGHHIHATQSPEFRDREDVAGDWQKRLQRDAMRRRHSRLLMMLRPFRPIFRLGVRAVQWQAARQR